MYALRFAIPFLIGTGYWYLSCQADPRLALSSVLFLTAGQVVLLAVFLFLAERDVVSVSVFEILLWAFLFRVVFLFDAPYFSDDLYRYLWDGSVAARGENPYAFAPAAFQGQVSGELASLLSRVNHPDLVSIYPPGAQLLFGSAWKIWPGLPGIKGLFLVLDIAACFMLTRLATLPTAAILYAWNPLAVIEISSSGHVDAALGFFVLLTLFLFRKRKFFAAGCSLGASAMIKILPVIFFPFFLRALFRPEDTGGSGFRNARRFLSGILLVTVLLAVPYADDLINMLHTLKVYATRWEFSGFLYSGLQPLFGGFGARIVLLALFGSLLSAIYLKGFPLTASLYLAAVSFLLVTPTLHPWYLLLFLIFLPLCKRPEGLILGWAALLLYHVLIDYALMGVWQENRLITMTVYCFIFAAFVLGWRFCRART